MFVWGPTTVLQWLGQRLSSENTPISSPSRESYGVSSVTILRIIDRIITAPQYTPKSRGPYWLRYISWSNSGFRAWKSYYLHKKIRYVIVNPYLESNDDLVKLRLNLESEWLIVSLSKNFRTKLLTHATISVASKQYVIKEVLSVINSNLGLKNRKYLAAFLKNLVLQRCAFFIKFMAQVGFFTVLLVTICVTLASVFDQYIIFNAF